MKSCLLRVSCVGPECSYIEWWSVFLQLDRGVHIYIVGCVLGRVVVLVLVFVSS